MMGTYNLLNKFSIKAWVGGIVKWYPSYWTSWTLTWWVLHNFLIRNGFYHYHFLEKSLLLALCASCIGGIWITYVKKRLIIRGFFPNDIHLSGYLLVVVDTITHHLPLYWYFKNKFTSDLTNHFRIVDSDLIPCYLLMIIYLNYNCIQKRYGLSYGELIIGWFLSHILHHILVIYM